MSFSEAVRRCLGQATTFSGRATRSEYWWFQLLAFLAGLSTCVVYVVLNAVSSALPLAVNAVAMVVVFIAALVIWVALGVASLAVFARRMHDVGHSGAWGLLVLIPFGAIVLLIFTCMDSAGPNRYGPLPELDWPGYYGPLGSPSG